MLLLMALLIFLVNAFYYKHPISHGYATPSNGLYNVCETDVPTNISGMLS